MTDLSLILLWSGPTNYLNTCWVQAHHIVVKWDGQSNINSGGILGLPQNCRDKIPWHFHFSMTVSQNAMTSWSTYILSWILTIYTFFPRAFQTQFQDFSKNYKMISPWSWQPWISKLPACEAFPTRMAIQGLGANFWPHRVLNSTWKVGMGRYHIFADTPISTSADTPILLIPILMERAASRQNFLLADTDTADTEKCADMPIFPIPILVSAHPYWKVEKKLWWLATDMWTRLATYRLVTHTRAAHA